jgi:hypothetical protein
MKTKTLFISIFFLLTVFSLHAMSEKQFLDTVIVKCNERVQVKIAVYDHSQLKKDTTLKGIISVLQKNLEKLRNNVPQGFYKIIYVPGESMVIENLAPVSKYQITGESVIPFVQKNECEVIATEFQLFFTFNDLDDMLNEDIIPCISATISKLPGKVRYAQTFNYQFSGKGNVSETQHARKSDGLDMLNLTGGIGAGFIKNTIAMDLGVELGFNFNKKGILKNGYYISGNAMYIFNDQSDHFAVNAFLNVGYRYNFSNDPKNSNWIGPEIGIPIHKEGSFFNDNMMRFAIRWEMGKWVYISGQLYVNDGFKSAYPGLRIGFFF